MGKAAKWLRGLLGLKKTESPSQAPGRVRSESKPPKRRWSFVKSYREKDRINGGERRGPCGEPHCAPYADGVDPNKRAVAVAAATAAVAEAAVAAAQAAAVVVRLTSSGRTATGPAYVGAGCVSRDEWAAVKIQAAFRAYLARRALRALRALVKLQALVRGHIIRKQTADMLRRMQALLRAQARARAGRAHVSESPVSSSKSSQFQYPGPATPEKFEQAVRAKTTNHDQSPLLKRTGSKERMHFVSKMEERLWDQRGSSMRTGPVDDDKTDKILEIDTGKPSLFASTRRNLSQFSHHVSSYQNDHSYTTSKDSTTHQTAPSQSSCEVQSSSPLKVLSCDAKEGSFCSAENSPQFFSASSKAGSSRRGPFTPTKSDGSRSYLSGFSDHPNYMACTESSRAKVRSLSAPKQRPQYERSNSAKRNSVHGFGDSRASGQRVSVLHSNFTNKAYPGSGRLDRLGMPLRIGDALDYNGGFCGRY
ncbi:protein IQ-DOMAIN 22-like [Malania oleifera]|uniref:protein IQ-DOMAIN 22-like n=1 Tax=Malania oleifera TaxID=397392 RepID=UPI0025ADB49B|nr:protein IQ-DOMAIN 22-like [Malania oleifera]